jgi:hypothetical protein
MWWPTRELESGQSHPALQEETMAVGFQSQKDFGSGLIFLFFGSVCVAIARNYPMGVVEKMGPGYFPTVLGTLLAVNGAALVIRSFLRSGTGIRGFSGRGVLLTMAAIICFSLLLKAAGLLIGVMALVMISAYASSQFRLWPSLLLAVGLSIFCGLVFVQALGLPIPLLGSWFPD